MSRQAALRTALARARYWLAVAEKLEPMETDKPSRLVEGWRSSWRWASMQFNALASILVGAALYNLDIIASVIAMAPPEVRSILPVPIAIGLFVTVAALRLWKQNRK